LTFASALSRVRNANVKSETTLENYDLPVFLWF
jgi:hypothetical protein